MSPELGEELLAAERSWVITFPTSLMYAVDSAVVMDRLPHVSVPKPGPTTFWLVLAKMFFKVFFIF